MSRPLGAQDRSLLELGASYVRFPQDSLSTFGPSIRWLAERERGRFATGVSGSGILTPAGVSGYGDVNGRWLVPVARATSVELAGEAGLLISSDARVSSANSSSVLLTARVLRAVRSGGLWLRGSGDLASREAGALWGRGIDGGGWWRWPGVQLVASLTREWTVAELFAGPRREGFVGVVPVQYTEGTASVRVERDATSFALSGTTRRDPGAEQLLETGLSATATYWPSNRMALFVSVARQLPDFVRGAEASRSFTVGIRLNDPSPGVLRVARMRPMVQVGEVDTARGGAPDSTRRMLRVRAPGATRVEVMADFTGWEAVELPPADGAFGAEFVLTPGTHRLAVRLDGGEWLPAVNTPAVDDDFGGKVGLLVVQ